MRALIVIAMVAAFVLPATAGSNPDCQVCIDFSGTATSWSNVQSRIAPDLYEPFDAYICIYGINAFSGISFTGYVTPGMSSNTWFTNLLPGSISIGAWDVGISMASTECHTERFVYLAKLDLIYTGTPGDVMILDHPDYPRWVVDCHEPYPELDFYCVEAHGTIGAGVCPESECDEPVEDATWGSIKALYR